MKEYNVVDYWNKRGNPCSKSIKQITSTHLEYLREQTTGCKKILDFGPGFGRMFSAYVDAEEVIGVDVTEQHKKELHRRAKKEGFKFSLICNTENFNKLEFVEKEFDAVVVSEVLFHQTPNMVERIMKELLRVGQKVIVITYMNLSEKYDKIGKHIPNHRYCFNYNYYTICKKNGWNLREEDRFRNQIFFVYSDIFVFKYDDI